MNADEFKTLIEESGLSSFMTPYSTSSIIDEQHIYRLTKATEPITKGVALRVINELKRGQRMYVDYPQVVYVETGCKGFNKQILQKISLSSLFVMRTEEGWVGYVKDAWFDYMKNTCGDLQLMNMDIALRVVETIFEPFDYAVINQKRLRLFPFMVSEKAFSETTLNSVLKAEITPLHLEVLKTIHEVSGSDCYLIDRMDMQTA